MAALHHDPTARPQTQVLRKGYVPAWSEGAAIPPVFRTSTFIFRNAQEGKSAFEIAYGLRPPQPGEVPALIYTRVNNPNVEILEDRVTVWDPKAEAAALFSSGMGSISTTCLTLMRPGDELVFTDPVYGGTEYLFRKMLPMYGMPTRTVPAGCDEATMDAALAACNGKARVLYLETPANPTISITDIRAAVRVAAKYSTPERKVYVVVDNTFLGPIFCQPHTHGADIVVYSATKFIGGHSDVVAGIATGSRELIGMIKGTRTILGSINEPDTAWLLMRSLPTLELRMRAEADSAQKIVRFLLTHPAVEKVFYPGEACMGAEHMRIFKEQYSGTGSIITFLIKGGEKEAFVFLDNLKHFHLAVSLGGVESLIQHPYTMTHSDMTNEEKAHAGITQNMIRASIGLEDALDLIEDLRQALSLVTP